VLITECTDEDLLVSVLGYNSGGKGLIIVYRMASEAWTEEFSIACEANGRLIQSGDPDGNLIWQSKKGGLFNGECHMTRAMHIEHLMAFSSFHGKAFFFPGILFPWPGSFRCNGWPTDRFIFGALHEK